MPLPFRMWNEAMMDLLFALSVSFAVRASNIVRVRTRWFSKQESDPYERYFGSTVSQLSQTPLGSLCEAGIQYKLPTNSVAICKHELKRAVCVEGASRADVCALCLSAASQTKSSDCVKSRRIPLIGECRAHSERRGLCINNKNVVGELVDMQ